MSLPGGEDYILRPVLEGLCKYESLLDGSLSLADIALLNDALDVRTENQRRVQEYQQAANNGYARRSNEV